MFALVKYSDNYSKICSTKQITKEKNGECIVKFKGCNYQGFIMATSGKF